MNPGIYQLLEEAPKAVSKISPEIGEAVKNVAYSQGKNFRNVRQGMRELMKAVPKNNSQAFNAIDKIADIGTKAQNKEMGIKWSNVMDRYIARNKIPVSGEGVGKTAIPVKAGQGASQATRQQALKLPQQAAQTAAQTSPSLSQLAGPALGATAAWAYPAWEAGKELGWAIEENKAGRDLRNRLPMEEVAPHLREAATETLVGQIPKRPEFYTPEQRRGIAESGQDFRQAIANRMGNVSNQQAGVSTKEGIENLIAPNRDRGGVSTGEVLRQLPGAFAETAPRYPQIMWNNAKEGVETAKKGTKNMIAPNRNKGGVTTGEVMKELPEAIADTTKINALKSAIMRLFE